MDIASKVRNFLKMLCIQLAIRIVLKSLQDVVQLMRNGDPEWQKYVPDEVGSDDFRLPLWGPSGPSARYLP